MVQIINDPYRKGNAFGSVGSALGQGLAEQLPKEVERGRLASGLERFSQQSPNQTPIQNFAQLSSIPGITPQMLQTFGELAKQQNIRNSFINNRKGSQRTSQTQDQFANDVANQKFAIDPNTYQRKLNQEEINPQREGPEFNRGVPLGNEQVNPQNPTNPQFQTRLPWTQDQRENFVGDYIQRHPEATPDQAYQEASRAEQNDLATPEAVQKEYQRLDDTRNKLNTSFDNKLTSKLQKNPIVNGVAPAELYKDITGENLEAMRRGMDKELALNPKKNIEDIADGWSTKALDLAKAKDKLRTVEKGDWLDFLIPGKREGIRNKLDQYSKIFADSGNSEEYYNKLISDFKMSPQGAASIAYPLSKKLSQYIKTVRINPESPKKQIENTRKYAYETENLITDDDSILSIARNLYEKDALFNQTEFFKQIQQDQDRLRLNSRQKREIAEGAQHNIKPSWGDFYITGQIR
jgi:hypothetical protein